MSSAAATLSSGGGSGSGLRKTLHHLGVLVGHSGAVKCIDLNSAHSLVASGGADRCVCVWDYRNMRLVRILKRHTGTDQVESRRVE